MYDFIREWNPEIGLWTLTGSGHTAPVSKLEKTHPAPNAAAKIVAAAQMNRLDEIKVTEVLNAIRQMQDLSCDDKHGCFRWYWEEPEVIDTNAAFFTGLGLIVLRKRWYDQLCEKGQNLLDSILADLKIWFLHAVEEASFFYPNKYLGDLVCAWLLAEIAGDTEAESEVSGKMLEAADYWLDNGWGWGEHMSDGYTSVCFVELGVLLLCSDKLPEQTRKKYLELSENLLSIEDVFGDYPRVPALRSYAFDKMPETVNFRNRVKEWKRDEELDIRNLPLFYDMFCKDGWHELFSERAKQVKEVSIPCFGGSKAVAHIEEDIRLGSMASFPLMFAAEHPTWGLSWQCFPVAFYRNAGGWGFLQWESKENGKVRCHPTADKAVGYLGNALSSSFLPPPVGRTYSLQKGSDLIAIRIMTPVPASWDCLTDRFKLVQAEAKTKIEARNNWSQLLLDYPERQISVNYIDPLNSASPKLSEEAGTLYWDASYSGETLADKRMLISVWGISLNGKIEKAPEINFLKASFIPRQEEEREFELHWQWPGLEWHLLIDPLDQQPIKEL
jgi:hypothetical protein